MRPISQRKDHRRFQAKIFFYLVCCRAWMSLHSRGSGSVYMAVGLTWEVGGSQGHSSPVVRASGGCTTEELWAWFRR